MIVGLGSDSSTNFLEVRCLMKLAGCLRRAVTGEMELRDSGPFPCHDHGVWRKGIGDTSVEELSSRALLPVWGMRRRL